jgi:hypothetical protein
MEDKMTHEKATKYLTEAIQELEQYAPKDRYREFYVESIEHAITVIERAERIAYTLRTKADFNVSVSPDEARGLARILMLETGID